MDDMVFYLVFYHTRLTPHVLLVNYSLTPNTGMNRPGLRLHVYFNKGNRLYVCFLWIRTLVRLSSGYLILSLSFPLSDAPCSSMLGMVSGQISDSQISVWPSAERGWLPEQARLLTGRTGWVVAHPQALGKNQSLELDLGFLRMVTGLILQGGKYRDLNIFIKRFRVMYSTNGTEWTYIQEENSNKVKVREIFFPCFIVRLIYLYVL